MLRSWILPLASQMPFPTHTPLWAVPARASQPLASAPVEGASWRRGRRGHSASCCSSKGSPLPGGSQSRVSTAESLRACRVEVLRLGRSLGCAACGEPELCRAGAHLLRWPGSGGPGPAPVLEWVLLRPSRLQSGQVCSGKGD